MVVKKTMIERGEPDALYESVSVDVSRIIDAARSSAARSVNAAMTAAYWLIGHRIVEFEQSGERRAEYGAALIERLSADLTQRFGRGFSRQNIQQMRMFYLSYPPEQGRPALSGESSDEGPEPIRQTPSGKSDDEGLEPIRQTPSGKSSDEGPEPIRQTPSGKSVDEGPEPIRQTPSGESDDDSTEVRLAELMGGLSTPLVRLRAAAIGQEYPCP